MKALDHNMLARYVCRYFHLGEWRETKGSVGGSFNRNLKIQSSQNHYIVRILNKTNTAEHLKYVQRILLTLSQQGVPAIVPETAPSGEPFVYYQGELVQVTPYCSAETFLCKQNQVYSSGSMLRSFHQALVDEEPGPMPGWSFFRPESYYEDAIRRLQSLFTISDSELSAIERYLERIWRSWNDSAPDLPETILHGDWHFWNQLYEGRMVRYILDFDFVQHGKRILDVAYTMWVIYMLLPEHSASFDHAFLKGYGPLTDAEADMLPTAIAIIALFFLCQAAHAANPQAKWKSQYVKQEPLVRWLMAEGGRKITQMAKNIARRTSRISS
ncbi:phosphotransferase [Marinicrinis lubricantis]|uniref:Phosphotransferase n=1 Tax=Marinicrinis lubricantis TaxID=2086470 RepID=A0ABW1IKY5_9BACL